MTDEVKGSPVLLRVPKEFGAEFQDDVHEAIRSLGGVPTKSILQFIANPEMIFRAVHPDMVNPFPDTILSGQELSLLNPEFRRNQVMSPLDPRFVKYCHAHADLAKNTRAAGLAISTVCRGMPYADEEAPVAPEVHIVVLLVVRITAAPDGEIDFESIRRLIFYLRQQMGFPIKSFSADGYQSVDFFQQMRKQGYTAELISVDRTTTVYDTFKGMLVAGRVHYPYCQYFMNEVQQLEKNQVTDKIQAPVLGSKDMADAVASTVWFLANKFKTTDAQDAYPDMATYDPRDQGFVGDYGEEDSFW